MGYSDSDDVAAAWDGDGGVGRDAIPPYGERHGHQIIGVTVDRKKGPSGHQRNAGKDPKGLAAGGPVATSMTVGKRAHQATVTVIILLHAGTRWQRWARQRPAPQ
jgi:hypothetical protein